MKILILGREDNFTKIIFNKIYEKEKDLYLITEDSPLKIKFIKNRIKNYGIIKVIGQILFLLIIRPILKFYSKDRINKLIKENGFSLNTKNFEKEKNYFHYKNINQDEVKEKILSISPDLIIVNGTRIIKKNILSIKNEMLFINMHSGITPKYRGVHGGYWALVNDDISNCGVTIHKIDLGIDTGDIISQKRISISPEDNFLTYPYLQLKMGIEEELKIIDLLKKGENIKFFKNNLESKLYTHPTLGEYIYNYIKHGVK